MLARYGSLTLILLLVVTAAWLGGGFAAGEWYYVDLTRPAWTPPGWAMGVAWAVVYLLLALAAWQVWLSAHYARLAALAWWALLLVLNVAWSAVFFGLHRIGWSPLVLLAAAGVAVLCMRAFRPLAPQAAWLILPYLAWVLFLCALNLTMWTLNGGPLARFFLGVGP